MPTIEKIERKSFTVKTDAGVQTIATAGSGGKITVYYRHNINSMLFYQKYQIHLVQDINHSLKHEQVCMK